MLTYLMSSSSQSPYSPFNVKSNLFSMEQRGIENQVHSLVSFLHYLCDGLPKVNVFRFVCTS